MSLVYRGVWNAKLDDVAASAVEVFGDWLASKRRGRYPVPAGLTIPTVSGESRSGDWVIRRDDGADEDGQLVRLQLEDGKADGSLWTTALTVWSHGDDAWASVQMDHYSTRPFLAGPKSSVPRLVDSALRILDCEIGGIPVQTQPMVARSPDQGRVLSQFIYSGERRLPLHVLSYTPFDEGASTATRANHCARAVKGQGFVACLASPGAQAAFEQAVGEDLKVYGGALRTYLPEADPREPWRHRYVPSREIQTWMGGEFQRWSQRYTAMANALGVPRDQAARVRSMLKGGPTDEELISDSVEILDRLDVLAELLEAAKDENALLRENARQALDERDEMLREVDRLERTVAFYRKRDGSALKKEPLDDSPERASSYATFTELVNDSVFTSRYDQLLWFGIGWLQAEELDHHPRRKDWLECTIEVCDALARYVLERRRDPEAPHLGRWLTEVAGLSVGFAENEGSMTKRDSSLVSARTFEVPDTASPTGLIEMNAHFKIGKGRDDPARMHVYDGTGGADKRVFIGYLGPHLTTAGSGRIR